MNPSYIKFDSPWGEGLLKIDATGAINGFWFYGQKYFPKINAALIIDAPDFLIDSDQSTLQMKDSFVRFQSEIEAYARGEISAFNLELAPEGTDFQKLVWALLLEVPYGETSTYGELASAAAQKLGKASMSAQAVGQAVGHNPISVVIPCHRILGKSGDLTGYAGGLDKKIALLKREGIIV
ncbi:MAG: hypothetical protein BGO41_11785 [Clostridiales bacterium 38-18]|nr:MAG: hypothetical protein BGO41_11785 [Clostridiales bacterium 38-18]